jgi:hypothetical protein
MVLHLSYDEGVFGVTFNDVTEDVVFYSTTSRFVVWFGTLCVGSCRTEQVDLLSQQFIIVTVEDSVLRTEMTGFESQEDDDPKCILFFNRLSWLGNIRPHRRDETWSAGL